MNKVSLLKAKEILIKNLDKAKIDKADKTELLLNLWLFLDEENYENNVDILKRYGKRRK